MYILEHPICVLLSFLIFYFFLILCLFLTIGLSVFFYFFLCPYFTASLATLSSFCGSSVSLDGVQRLLPSTFLSLHCIPFCSTRYLFHPFSVFSLALFFPFSYLLCCFLFMASSLRHNFLFSLVLFHLFNNTYYFFFVSAP